MCSTAISMRFACRRAARPGMALEQTQFSRISGAGTAAVPEGGGWCSRTAINFSNTFFALDLEVSPTCLSITFNHNGLNTFFSPYFDCVTAVNATASDRQRADQPELRWRRPSITARNSVGISVVGTGSRPSWMFPSAATYTAAPIDDGIGDFEL